MRIRGQNPFSTIRTEGGLLPPDLLARIAAGDRSLEGLNAADYHLAAGERLTEAIARSWTRLLAAWRAFDAERRELLPSGDAAAGLTRDRWLQVLFSELGYGRLVKRPTIEIEGKQYPVFSQWQHTPIHLVGAGVRLDARTPGVPGAAGQSPHSLLQELLNRSDERLWGIVSNGLRLRLLRDNVALTRQAYVEFDLEAMFSGEVYADFVLLWLVCHESRVESENPHECWLERWTHVAADSGTRALDALRHGVQEAIETLGGGFLAHPANHELHAALRDGVLEPGDYYRVLLRLVYRLLFLFVAEDRDALLDPNGDPVAAKRYVDHYSTAHLRELARRRRGGRHSDRYEQLTLVMRSLHRDGCAPLALPALGSYLWDPQAIGPLAGARLANVDLFSAIRSLATVYSDGVRRAVDFRNLGAEELGSVYESLLELHPTLDRSSASFTLETVTGSERKQTGSYYTPTSLIASLLDTALDPVLDEAARSTDPERAILSLAVVDPACGAGHFLIAAAHRIAKRLAALRADDPEPAPELIRAALRDVVGHCLQGVDANPMAVELCKVSLWMEALEPGRPLSFLDHRIVLGNSLLGATPELIASGIPAPAFKPILGDDRAVVAALKKRNDTELGGQLVLDVVADRIDADAHALAVQATELDRVDDHSLAGAREQQQRFERLLASDELRRARLVADVWCAAFVVRKDGEQAAITQDVLSRAIGGGEATLSAAELAVVDEARREYEFLHWHIAFPDVWERGGFDVVLGNPPWERVKLQEKEFFAARSPEIAAAPNKAARERLIAALVDDDPRLLSTFQAAKRQAEGASHLIRDSGRYPLCGRGDVNTYAVFAELMRGITGPRGRAGVIVPTGIATDDTTKRFFQELVRSRSLASLLGFYDRKQIFTGADVHGFCLFTTTGTGVNVDAPSFVFFARKIEDLGDPERRFTLTAEEIALLNPNTGTCPVFRTRRDAELTKAIYQRVPVLVREDDPDGNPWGIRFSTMFHMSNDSRLFRTRDQLEAEGAILEGNVFRRGDERWLPLYEAKMLHHYDHRWATYDNGDTRELTEAEKRDPDCLALPRYWVPAPEVDDRLSGWSHEWLLAWRDICRNTDERTVIAGAFSRVAVNHKLLLCFTDPAAPELAVVFSSFIFDFVARQKVGGTSMSYFVMRQLPVAPRQLVPSGFCKPRLLELTYTATDVGAFAADLGYDGLPFRWDPGRRALIRAELDALMFRLYGIGRDDVEYIMDTFPIVRRRDEQRFGEYRTKRLILERFDAMAAADAAGEEYETPLDPPPGDPRAAHAAGARAVV